MTRLMVTISFLVAGLVGSVLAVAERLPPQATVDLKGDMAHQEELSGASFFHGLLIACPDEGAELNVLKSAGSDYELLTTVNLLCGSDEEIDMEGAASDSQHLYIIGSHSIRRKRIDEDGTQKKNRKRLARIAPHDDSYSVFRIKIDNNGQLTSNDRISLKSILENDEVLQTFCDIPGKENGVDIEGIAVKDGMLHVGFRGPVLRGNFVPVLSFAFDRPNDYELRYVRLDGRGIRDLVAVENGFLILAGAVGDGDASYRLYFWNGEDCVPLSETGSERLIAIGEVEPDTGAKPEGVAVVGETADEWRLLILSDGSSHAKELVAPKPNAR